ncbi:DUF397 domain-containing protein [Streptosporangium sp. NBC_01469]|uniref:DUF397 domain-containing protein n=1 Tax=Streptosporangium sp. NBC_01469 TaxID=2903898 RepID=UPI002E29D0A2|nr:DUF397 domain-containing protein [Streptosporangium sp. NBC_01469]
MDDLTQELGNAQWRKSTLSGSDGSDCVEVANLSGGHRGIRDSKDRNGPALILTPYQWAALLNSVKNGDLA